MNAGGREFRFRRDLYSQESTFPLVDVFNCLCDIAVLSTGIWELADMDVESVSWNTAYMLLLVLQALIS